VLSRTCGYDRDAHLRAFTVGVRGSHARARGAHVYTVRPVHGHFAESARAAHARPPWLQSQVRSRFRRFRVSRLRVLCVRRSVRCRDRTVSPIGVCFSEFGYLSATLFLCVRSFSLLLLLSFRSPPPFSCLNNVTSLFASRSAASQCLRRANTGVGLTVAPDPATLLSRDPRYCYYYYFRLHHDRPEVS